jgi:hypothetical protein
MGDCCLTASVSGLHISHISTFMKNFGTNRHPAQISVMLFVFCQLCTG